LRKNYIHKIDPSKIQNTPVVDSESPPPTLFELSFLFPFCDFCRIGKWKDSKLNDLNFNFDFYNNIISILSLIKLVLILIWIIVDSLGQHTGHTGDDRGI
jgi:hypothetical protein